MELRTGFNCIDNILCGGFLKGDSFTLGVVKEPEVNWRDTADINWPHRNQGVYHYAVHYRIDGVDTVDYFWNGKELHFWYKLREKYQQTDGQFTEIITLYMWDSEKGPVEIEDIIPHFECFQTEIFINIFKSDFWRMYKKSH